MSDRVSCCVPFCRRTIAAEKIAPHSEWVCSRHWALVPAPVKSEYRRAKARARKIYRGRPIYREYWRLPVGSPQRVRAVSVWRRLHSVWDKCKRAAIETGAGI